jgi:uncharacterized membrane protein
VLVARAPWSLRLGCLLAWTNLLLAVLLGGAMALQHTHPLLPVDHVQAMQGHAHLALGGFAGTLVAAVGMRLLPMFLPALPPPAPLSLAAVLGLGGGGFLCGIGVLLPCLLDAGLWTLCAGACCWLLAGIAMLVRRRPQPPSGLPRLLPAHVLTFTAMLSFAAATGLGVLLHGHVLDASWWGPYGSVLLLGGFGSLILGIGQRLVPLARRLRTGIADAHRPGAPALAAFTAGAWLAGVLLLPVALRSADATLLRAAMVLLGAAAAADAANLLRR